MKRLYIKLTLTTVILAFGACSSSKPVAPSQNSALNSISKSSGKEKGNKSFTLQEFVDKSDVYFKAKENASSDSHVQKLESMPVIGK